jgi:seryl-tRNA synthetase
MKKSFNPHWLNKIIKIQKQWRRYYIRKVLNIDKDNLNSYISFKYRKKDPVLMKYIIEVNKKSDSFIKENNELRQKINELSIKISKSGKNIFSNISVPSLNLSNSGISSINLSNTFTMINSSFRNEINIISRRDDNSFKNDYNNAEIMNLKKKINNSKKRYNDLINTASEYEKKMVNFVKLINSNPEIKAILSKHGVHFN